MPAFQRSSPTVVVVDHRFPDLAPERAVLGAIGATVVDGNKLDPAGLEAALATADGVLLGARFPMNREQIARLASCRSIVRYGIGVDNVDLEAAAERGIVVSNVPEYCIEEVATHAVALFLALHRQLLPLMAQARSARWAIPAGLQIPRLSELCVGVIGFGRIGQEVAARLRPFGVRLVAYDPYQSPAAIRQAGAEPCTLEALVAAADAITLHLPLTAQTRHLISRDILRRMKAGAILINVSRGGLVDQAALHEALVSGHLGGAGLDVTDPEPPAADDPLLSLPNVIVTPHVAWLSQGAQRDLQRMAAEEVARVLAGAAPRWALRPA